MRVLLPKDYEKDTDRSYPVVYFHDGQNVFIAKSLSLDTMEDYPSHQTKSRYQSHDCGCY